MSSLTQRTGSTLATIRSTRDSERVDMKVEVGIDDHTGFYVGVTQNLSAGGLFISTPKLWPPGTQLALTFVMPQERPLFVRAVVRWVRDAHEIGASDVRSGASTGMGVEFVGITERDQAAIIEYVQEQGPFFESA